MIGPVLSCPHRLGQANGRHTHATVLLTLMVVMMGLVVSVRAEHLPVFAEQGSGLCSAVSSWMAATMAPDAPSVRCLGNSHTRPCDAWYQAPLTYNLLPLCSWYESSILSADLGVLDAVAGRHHSPSSAPAVLGERVPLVKDLDPSFVPLFGSMSLCTASAGHTPPLTTMGFDSFCDAVAGDGSGSKCLAVSDTIPSVWFDHFTIAANGPQFFHAFTLGNVSFTNPQIHAVLDTLVRLGGSGAFAAPGPESELAVMACGILSDGVANATSRPQILEFPVGPHPESHHAALVQIVALASPVNGFDPLGSAQRLVDYAASLVNVTDVYGSDTNAVFPLWSALESLIPASGSSPSRIAYWKAANTTSQRLTFSSLALGIDGMATRWNALLHSAMGGTSNSSWVDEQLELLEVSRLQAIQLMALAPSADPPPGVYTLAVKVTLTTVTPLSTIVYTVDGSDPSLGGPTVVEYNPTAGIPLSVSGDWYIRAMTTTLGTSPSPVATFKYSLDIADGSNTELSTALLLAIVIPLTMYLTVVLVVAKYLFNRWTANNSAADPDSLRLSVDDSLVISPSDIVMNKVVGTGAYGVVHQAVWRGAAVAVKQPHVAPESRAELQTFVDEAKALLSLRHRNIVLFMGVLLEPKPQLVTEFLERGSLYDIIHDRTLFLHNSIVFHWIVGVAKGLAFIHAAGIIHADLKSLNVLFDVGWTPKIVDFGVSLLHQPNVAVLKSSSEVEAPPNNALSLFWAAPEILQGSVGSPTEASDVYALAITMYELAMRSDPYPNESPMAVALQVCEGRRPSIDRVPTDVAALLPVMEAMWARVPSDRLSPTEVVSRIEGLYETALVQFPSSLTAPLGNVVMIELSLSQQDLVTARSMHSTLQSSVESSGGIIFATTWCSAFVVLHRPIQLLQFFDSFGAFIKLHEILMTASFGAVSRSSRDSHELSGSAIEVIRSLRDASPNALVLLSDNLQSTLGDALIDHPMFNTMSYVQNLVSLKGLMSSTLVSRFINNAVSSSVGIYAKEYVVLWRATVSSSGASGFLEESSHMDHALVKLSLKQHQMSTVEILSYGEAVLDAMRVGETSPLLIAPIGFCLEPPHISFVIPHCPNGLLLELLETTSPLPVTDLIAIAQGIIAGLTVLHNADMAHGALSPESVAVSKNAAGLIDGCQLLDFNTEQVRNSMATMTVAPNAAYEAPETLATGSPSLASDLFAFGSIVYEMATGTKAFSGSNSMEIGFKILNIRVPDLITAPIPSPLCTIIAACWEPNPEARPSPSNVQAMLTSASSSISTVAQ